MQRARTLRERVEPVFALVEAGQAVQLVGREAYERVWRVVKVEGDDQRSVEVLGAECLERVGVEVSGQALSLALQVENVQA